jgi:hypothetical protein
MSVLEKLTEGIVKRSLQQEGTALLEKWDRTGLLEGLGADHKRNTMARLLENQAAQLLKEASSMQGGDVEGFASVAFPIVRRVFAGLVANDIVSVQPMSLPSGLIFFLDFQATDTRGLYSAGDSLYGGNVVGAQLTGGVDLATDDGGGFYNLRNGYASPSDEATGVVLTTVASGTLGVNVVAGVGELSGLTLDLFNSICRHDPDLSGSGVVVTKVSASVFSQLNTDNLTTIALTGSDTHAISGSHIRRLTSYARKSDDLNNPDNVDKNNIYLFFKANSADDTGIQQLSATLSPSTLDGDTATSAGNVNGTLGNTHSFNWNSADNFIASDTLGAVKGASEWLLESTATTSTGVLNDTTGDIPEIDIQVDSIAVTAITKKLKAKWTPELGQDLNAYHNLDAEVELTSILSEQIALEIDREILSDLVNGATAEVLYWSRRPGKFVNRQTGTDLTGGGSVGPDFTGNVSEWYETLVETINDVSAQIHRKTLRGGANFIVVSPEIANLLEFTSGFRASVTLDDDKGTVGAVKVGSLSKKWDVYVDPYFLRNVVLVGRKGGSFLESGYVYAPYVPLQVTPTIFGTEDFVPRKGVMTRYAKKMVRPDMYGLVIVSDLLG